MLWTVAADGTCDYVNARWLEFTGRPLGAELGSGWTDRIHPDDRQGCLEEFRKSLAQRAPLRHEYRMRRYDDQYRWLLDVAVPRFDRGRRVPGLDRMQHRRHRPPPARAAPGAGRACAGDRSARGRHCARLQQPAHRHPGPRGLLLEEPGLSALGREDLAQIQRSAERAASLTRQLLAFSRRQVLAPRVLDLNQVVAGCLSRLRRLAGERVQVV